MAAANAFQLPVPDTLMIEVLSFTITDGQGRTMTHYCTPPVRAFPGVNGGMWESEIPNAKGKLASGQAIGVGSGMGFTRGQAPSHFTWTQPVGSLNLAIE